MTFGRGFLDSVKTSMFRGCRREDEKKRNMADAIGRSIDRAIVGGRFRGRRNTVRETIGLVGRVRGSTSNLSRILGLLIFRRDRGLRQGLPDTPGDSTRMIRAGAVLGAGERGTRSQAVHAASVCPFACIGA